MLIADGVAAVAFTVKPALSDNRPTIRPIDAVYLIRNHTDLTAHIQTNIHTHTKCGLSQHYSPNLPLENDVCPNIHIETLLNRHRHTQTNTLTQAQKKKSTEHTQGASLYGLSYSKHTDFHQQ